MADAHPSSEVDRSVAIMHGRSASDSVLAAHADLIWTLVRTDFKVRYQGRCDRFVWATLK